MKKPAPSPPLRRDGERTAHMHGSARDDATPSARRVRVRRVVYAANMPASVALLLEADAAHVRARDGGRVRPAGTLAVRALERPTVEVHHADVAVEAVEKGELAPAGPA